MWQDRKGGERKKEDDEEKKIGPEYARFVNSVVSKVEPQSRQAVAQVLTDPKVRETYEILEEEGLPRATIHSILSSEEALRHLSKYGGKITVPDYLAGVVDRLRKNERYEEILEEMHEEGVLSDRAYTEAKKDMKKDTSKHLRHATSRLEHLARAAAYFFIISGVLLILISGFAVTGGVIGSGIVPSSTFVAGLVVFVTGLVLNVLRN